MYRQLFLSCGYAETTRLTTLAVSCNHNGFQTWKEAIVAFRQSLLMVVQQQAVDEGCKKCRGSTQELETRYCSWCGRRLSSDQRNYHEEVTALFREWFDTELHAFRDWDLLSEDSWDVGAITSNGDFVTIHEFDRLLQEWDEVDWNTEEVTIGTIKGKR